MPQTELGKNNTAVCEKKRAVKPRASRLAESSRGRASRSRRKSDVTTNNAIADYFPAKKARAITKIRA